MANEYESANVLNNTWDDRYSIGNSVPPKPLILTLYSFIPGPIAVVASVLNFNSFQSVVDPRERSLASRF